MVLRGPLLSEESFLTIALLLRQGARADEGRGGCAVAGWSGATTWSALWLLNWRRRSLGRRWRRRLLTTAHQRRDQASSCATGCGAKGEDGCRDGIDATAKRVCGGVSHALILSGSYGSYSISTIGL